MSSDEPRSSADGRLRAAVAEILEIDAAEVEDATSPQTVKRWNSMTHMKLVARVEGAFGVRLPVREVIRIKSVGDLRRVLAGQGVELG